MSPWQQELGNRPSSLNGSTHMNKQVMHITMSASRATFLSTVIRNPTRLWGSYAFDKRPNDYVNMTLHDYTTVESCITWLWRFLKGGEPIAWCLLITALKLAFIKLHEAAGRRALSLRFQCNNDVFFYLDAYWGLSSTPFPPNLYAMRVKVLSHLYTLPTWTPTHYYWWGTELES